MGWLGKNRLKVTLVLFGLMFAAMEIPQFLIWVREIGGISHANDHYFKTIFNDKLFKMTIIDLTATSVLIFAWMMWDSVQLRQLWLPIFACLIMLFSPTVGVLFYLIFRPNQPFFPPSPSKGLPNKPVEIDEDFS